MRIGVDVDLTLVDTGKEWFDYLSKGVDYPFSIGYFMSEYKVSKIDYNLSSHFRMFSAETGKHPFDFWKQEDLYDNLLPLAHSVSVINKIVEAGHDIVFISHCHGGHFSSKVKWLNKYFPFTDIGGKGGFIATKEKHLVNVDVMIDDRIENLLHFGDEVIKIYVDTIYEDPDFDKKSVDFVSSLDDTWSSIGGYLKEVDII